MYLSEFNNAVKGYDLIHTVELRSAFSLQAVRAKKMGLVKSVTATIYENIPFLYDEYKARRTLKEEVLAGIDHFLAANDASKQSLIAEGADPTKISIIPQSLDTEIFMPIKNINQRNKLRHRYGFAADDFIVLATGRMVWEKGWWDAVRAAFICQMPIRQLADKCPIKFFFVGDGPEKIELKRLVDQLGLEKQVIFTGMLAFNKMPEVYQISDVFVHPSLPTPVWNEQFGGALIEAMSTGLPIIATVNGGTKETVGEGNFLVPPQDFAAVTKNILKLQNPYLRQKIGKLNRQQVLKKYSTEVVAKKIKEIWDRLC